MSDKQVTIDLPFGDGVYTFALPIAQCRELEEKCGAGILAIYGRIMKGRHLIDGELVAVAMDGASFLDDMEETIRLGLIGGNRGVVKGAAQTVSPQTALQLIERYVRSRPLSEAWAIAGLVLTARILGILPEDAAALVADTPPPGGLSHRAANRGGRRSRTTTADAATASAVSAKAA